jgi:hypothetical protein
MPKTQDLPAQTKANREPDPFEGVTVPHNINGEIVNVPYFPYAVLHNGRCYKLSNSRYGSDRDGVLTSEPALFDDSANKYFCAYG